MDSPNKNLLRKHYVKLTEAYMEEIIDYLYQEKIIQLQEKESIEAKATNKGKARNFLDMVIAKGEYAATRFLEGLKKYIPHCYDEIIKCKGDCCYVPTQHILNTESLQCQIESEKSITFLDNICENIDLLMIGKTGNGKSATANTILRMEDVFETGASCNSITRNVQKEYTKFKNRKITVVDGPGVGDTYNMTDIEKATHLVIESMKDAVKLNPEGYHAFILVVKFGGRFTKEDTECIRILKHIFGIDFIEHYCILLVTHGDNFVSYQAKRNQTFSEWCRAQEGHFRDLLIECNNRVVLFDNNTTDKNKQDEQLQELIGIVDRLQYGRHRYKLSNFKLSEKYRELLMVQAKEPIIREEIMKEYSFLMQDIQTVPENDDISVQIDIFENITDQMKKLRVKLQQNDKGTGTFNDIQQLIDSALVILAEKKSYLTKISLELTKSKEIDEVKRKYKKNIIETKKEYEKLMNSQKQSAERYKETRIMEEKQLREREQAKRRDAEERERQQKKMFEKERQMLLNDLDNHKKEYNNLLENHTLEEQKLHELKAKLEVKENQYKYQLQEVEARQENELKETKLKASEQIKKERELSKQRLKHEEERQAEVKRIASIAIAQAQDKIKSLEAIIQERTQNVRKKLESEFEDERKDFKKQMLKMKEEYTKLKIIYEEERKANSKCRIL